MKKKASVSLDDTTEKLSRIIILSADVDNNSISYIMERIFEINEYDDDNEEMFVDYYRKPIKLIINSFGGSIYDGFALIGVIENSKTPVHTYCYGSAMSMGLLIFVSGHLRLANRLATFMYHECLDEPNYDKLTTLKEGMEESKRIMDIYDKQLLNKSSLKRKQLDETKKMKLDWYMTPEQGKQFGFVDKII